MVSQPAIVPGHVGGNAAELESLRMKGRGKNGFIPLAREVAETGSQATLVSTVLWSAVHSRLNRSASLKTAWCVHDNWDLAALLARKACAMTAPIVVDMSPLRRVQDADLPVATGEGPWSTCMGAT